MAYTREDGTIMKWDPKKKKYVASGQKKEPLAKKNKSTSKAPSYADGTLKFSGSSAAKEKLASKNKSSSISKDANFSNMSGQKEYVPPPTQKEKLASSDNKYMSTDQAQLINIGGQFLKYNPVLPLQFLSNLQIFKEAEAIARTDNAQRSTNLISKRDQAEANLEKTKRLGEAKKDLYDTTFLERLGIGVSEEEKGTKDLLNRQQYYDTYGSEVQNTVTRYVEYQKILEDPTAQKVVQEATSSGSGTNFLDQAKPWLIGAGALLAVVFIGSLIKK